MLLNSLNLIQSVPLPTARPLSKAWQVGQLLHALVLNRSQSGQLELQIGQEKITARTNAQQNFQPGEKLTLQVVKNHSEPVLRVVERQTQQPLKPVVEQLLRHSLPKADLAPLLSKLNQPDNPVNSLRNNTTQAVPEPVRQQIGQLKTIIHATQELRTAQAVKQAVEQSGMFMEARVAKQVSEQSPPVPVKQFLARDFKANLLRLASIINNSVAVKAPPDPGTAQTQQPVQKNLAVTQQTSAAQTRTQLPVQEISRLFELRQMVDAAIARIQVNQSNAIVIEDQTPPVWIIDLPLKDGAQTTLVHIQISQEEAAKKQDEATRRWHLSLSFELEGLGNIDVRVTYFNGEITSSIWAENEATYRAMEHNLSHLTKRLDDAGLRVGSIQCYPGKMAPNRKAEEPKQPLLSVSL